MGSMREFPVPTAIPVFLPTDGDAYLEARSATVAQWRIAERKLRMEPSDRRLVRQMLRIADALGIAEDAALWPEVQVRRASNVTNLPETPPAD